MSSTVLIDGHKQGGIVLDLASFENRHPKDVAAEWDRVMAEGPTEAIRGLLRRAHAAAGDWESTCRR